MRAEPNPRQPYRIYRAGGRRFAVFLEYDEQMQESYPVYPDFEEHPVYTDDGRPFATAEQESCPYCKAKLPGKPLPGDCGGCFWFYREQTPYDPIGVCLCDARQIRNPSHEET